MEISSLTGKEFGISHPHGARVITVAQENEKMFKNRNKMSRSFPLYLLMDV